MKKLLALIFTVIFVFTLSACNRQSSASEPKLTAEEALNIALKQAGVTEESITGLQNHLERDDDILVYEIDFESGNMEYSYDINAETGAVVERDHDRND